MRAQIIFTCLASIVVVTLLTNAEPNETPDLKPEANNVPGLFNFSDYVNKYKKAYGPLEALTKANLFFGRTLKIFQHNVLFNNKVVSYFLGQNVYTDISPEELKKMYENDLGLEPVNEALEHPDLPANSLVSVRILTGKEDEEEQMSQSSLEDISNKNEQRKKVQRPIVSFFDETDQVGDPKEILRELKKRPDVAAKIAQVVDLPPQQTAKDLQIESKIEDARKAGGIEQTQVVASDNEHYEAPLFPSYGLFGESFEKFQNDFAGQLMDDWTMVEPYPITEAPKDKVLSQLGDDTPKLSGLLNSVKSIYNLFSVERDFEEASKASPEPSKESNTKPLAKVDSKSSSIRYNIDWRITGCLTEPKHQDSCNSCYAFTTLAMMEYLHCRQTKKLTDFSAQFVVDCGNRFGLNGCQGGKLSLVGQFIKEYGVELDSGYVYKATENSCPYSRDDEIGKKVGYLKPKLTHWHKFTSITDWYKWLRKSPLLVGINMPSDFMAYKGGIHPGTDCAPNMTHAILLVGSGMENGEEFWLFKNSFSTDWGEKGYFRLAKSAPLRCFDAAIVARAKFNV